MKKLRHLHDLNTIAKELGQDYSFIEKVNLKGVGSPKIIYVKGIAEFDKLSSKSGSHNFTNFRLLPSGLILTLSKNNETTSILIHKDEIESIHILARKIYVRKRNFLSQLKKHLVYDAKMDMKINDSVSFSFYILTNSFNPVVSFFKKAWVNEKLFLSISPEPPITDPCSLL